MEQYNRPTTVLPAIGRRDKQRETLLKTINKLQQDRMASTNGWNQQQFSSQQYSSTMPFGRYEDEPEILQWHGTAGDSMSLELSCGETTQTRKLAQAAHLLSFLTGDGKYGEEMLRGVRSEGSPKATEAPPLKAPLAFAVMEAAHNRDWLQKRAVEQSKQQAVKALCKTYVLEDDSDDTEEAKAEREKQRLLDIEEQMAQKKKIWKKVKHRHEKIQAGKEERAKAKTEAQFKSEKEALEKHELDLKAQRKRKAKLELSKAANALAAAEAAQKKREEDELIEQYYAKVNRIHRHIVGKILKVRELHQEGHKKEKADYKAEYALLEQQMHQIKTHLLKRRRERDQVAHEAAMYIAEEKDRVLRLRAEERQFSEFMRQREVMAELAQRHYEKKMAQQGDGPFVQTVREKEKEETLRPIPKPPAKAAVAASGGGRKAVNANKAREEEVTAPAPVAIVEPVSVKTAEVKSKKQVVLKVDLEKEGKKEKKEKTTTKAGDTEEIELAKTEKKDEEVEKKEEEKKEEEQQKLTLDEETAAVDETDSAAPAYKPALTVGDDADEAKDGGAKEEEADKEETEAEEADEGQAEDAASEEGDTKSTPTNANKSPSPTRAAPTPPPPSSSNAKPASAAVPAALLTDVPVSSTARIGYQWTPQLRWEEQIVFATMDGNADLVEEEIFANSLTQEERVEYLNRVDWEGDTILLYAMNAGNYRVMKVLLEHGCDPNVQDASLSTCLHYACAAHREDMVKLLLRYKADHNVLNDKGKLCWTHNGMRSQVNHWHAFFQTMSEVVSSKKEFKAEEFTKMSKNEDSELHDKLKELDKAKEKLKVEHQKRLEAIDTEFKTQKTVIKAKHYTNTGGETHDDQQYKMVMQHGKLVRIAKDPELQKQIDEEQKKADEEEAIKKHAAEVEKRAAEAAEKEKEKKKATLKKTSNKKFQDMKHVRFKIRSIEDKIRQEKKAKAQAARKKANEAAEMAKKAEEEEKKKKEQEAAEEEAGNQGSGDEGDGDGNGDENGDGDDQNNGDDDGGDNRNDQLVDDDDPNSIANGGDGMKNISLGKPREVEEDEAPAGDDLAIADDGGADEAAGDDLPIADDGGADEAVAVVKESAPADDAPAEDAGDDGLGDMLGGDDDVAPADADTAPETDGGGGDVDGLADLDLGNVDDLLGDINF